MKAMMTWLFSVLLLAAATPAIAQVALPYVPPETVREHRWVEGSKVRFCVWSVSPTVALDRRIAEEIGSTLLLEVEIYEYTNTIPQFDDNFWEEVYTQLAERCDALMGFVMVSEIVPDWLTPTRPYYEGPFVAAVTNPGYAVLGDLPPASTIGAMLYTTAGQRLMEYIATQPEDRRWKRLPFTSPQQLLDYLQKGTVQASLFWAPSLVQLTGGNPEAAGVKIIPLDPVSVQPTPIGMMLREHNIFLRTQLDRAIESMIADGIIEQVLAEVGLPVAGVPRQ